MWRPESVYDASGHLDEGVVHGWLDGALAEESAREVESHAASCGECAARVAEARGLIAGAGRVLGALDAGVSGAGNPDAGAPVRPVGIGGGSGALGTRPPVLEVAAGRASPTRRGTTRRISLAAAAALVFVAGTVVLRDELGGGRGVREAIVGDRREEMVSAPSRESVPTPEASLDAAGGGAGPAREASTAEAAPPPPQDRSVAATAQRQAVAGRIGGRALPPAPTATAPSPFPTPEASPRATGAAEMPAAPPPAAPAPSAQVGNVAAGAAPAADAAASDPTARTEQRAPARRLGAMASAPRAPEAAKSIDRPPAAEAVVTPAAPGVTRAAEAARSAMAPQRIDDSLYNVTPPRRIADAWMIGCWRVGVSNTMLLFDREGLMSRVYTASGEWHVAIRIAGDVRSVAQWRRDRDSSVRVRAWETSSDMLIWAGRDSLEAALVPRGDIRPLALTEQQRIDREARRRERSAAYERRLRLVRQDPRLCAPQPNRPSDGPASSDLPGAASPPVSPL